MNAVLPRDVGERSRHHLLVLGVGVELENLVVFGEDDGAVVGFVVAVELGRHRGKKNVLRAEKDLEMSYTIAENDESLVIKNVLFHGIPTSMKRI